MGFLGVHGLLTVWGCHVHFCSISLTEYHDGATDFNETGSRNKNNTCHPEIIKTRRPDVTDTPSSPKEQKIIFFFCSRENTINTCEFIYQVTSLARQKN